VVVDLDVMLHQVPPNLEDLVVAMVLIVQAPDQVILHPHHHHKEMPVVAKQHLSFKVVVEEVLEVLDIMQRQIQALVDMVDWVFRFLSQDHQHLHNQ